MDLYIGQVIHYYNRIGVAVLKLYGDLRTGDKILILGHSTDLIQPVCSMETNHQKIQSAGQGAEVAVKVIEPVRRGDQVYKVVEEKVAEVSPDSPIVTPVGM